VVCVSYPQPTDPDRRAEVLVRLKDVEGLTAVARWAGGDGAAGGGDRPAGGRGGATTGGAREPAGARGRAGRGRGRGRVAGPLQPGRPVRVRLRSVDASRGRVQVDIVST
jgi:hypothetical protein